MKTNVLEDFQVCISDTFNWELFCTIWVKCKPILSIGTSPTTHTVANYICWKYLLICWICSKLLIWTPGSLGAISLSLLFLNTFRTQIQSIKALKLCHWPFQYFIFRAPKDIYGLDFWYIINRKENWLF